MFWFFGHVAYGILGPLPEIKPKPSALEGEVLATGLPVKSLACNYEHCHEVYFSQAGYHSGKEGFTFLICRLAISTLFCYLMLDPKPPYVNTMISSQWTWLGADFISTLPAALLLNFSLDSVRAEFFPKSPLT